LLKEGVKLVENSRYFTIWAPRQTGKSTYFRQLSIELEKYGFQTVHFNVENYLDATKEVFLEIVAEHFEQQIGVKLEPKKTFTEFEKEIRGNLKRECVLVLDEIEGLNPEIFGQFLHTVRNLYHTREDHCLKSVILVGVSNIVGVVQDNASPFNIADNLNIPYFTEEEVFELLHQHEEESGQLFERKVKEKLFGITAGQPGLVNGFAKKLVDDYPDEKVLTYNHYLKVEDWYLRIAIDKNFANILNRAKEERAFVERLLFTEDEIPFKIDRESIKILHTNGLIKDDGRGFVTFWVPFYKKRLYDAFYPYTNGEKANILRSFVENRLLDAEGNIRFDEVIAGYKAFVKRRGFKPFMEKDENGRYINIKESALVYSFETYIQAFLQVVNGKSYREADTGLGKSDLIINVKGKEYLIETKIYYYESRFSEGKRQLAYYCKSLGLTKGVYLVFCPTGINYPATVKEGKELINEVEILTYLVEYDDDKW
jgi:hypothetical protein